ncbi:MULTISPECIES: D-cysteine desulfhydrase [Desulfitobacterium]|uniref:Pyridoxal phosphate-dependent enzyme, D-cysteine desulfhydrase family n=1 Tax=Desulfitobacterium dehalogenans (strain ATCC 51507 / DSM 9161 / JW/IU-DC1) TaxID=756499 RepID=I4A4X7_DESDJ|nr:MULTISPECIES: D-cysteine desulfhydrase [Desulfitobacterium]AFL99011.1 pyridoxal phosphate-dependent enzyme, D-cysteine desulfhydrase family [Desulfitobacterium dehalogenans ATCC 51507]
MNLAQFKRRRYTEGKTPLEFLPNFSKALGGPNIYIKRDDLLGLTSGGNKTRKLEFLMQDALDQGADTIITCGAVQSNHCRLTLAAAVKEGLKCRLVLEERVKDSYNLEASGNNFLFHVLGVEKVSVVAGGSNMLEAMQKVANELAAEGRKGYIVPGGGSNPIGTLGYVACAQEISEQMFEKGINFDHLVCASGSGGTHSGLLVGFQGNNMNIPVTGISVNRSTKAQENLIFDLANKTAEKIGLKIAISREAVKVVDEYVGPGYSLPTETMVEAVQLLARTEGILLDPVYTGKTMAGLIGLIRQGQLKKGENVVFVHTGGSPALYAYMPTILGKDK